MTEIINTLKQLKENKRLEPYINYIRFPCYRNLKSNLKISFDFPLTAIVGQNGTNKSSVLRAVWGCPEGNSLARFWFSTDVDRITEDAGRPRFIYSYYQQEAQRNVEVIKMRVQRKGKHENWEPNRPRISDDMEKMPPIEQVSVGRLETRWNLIQKNAIYLDFRSEISAFDKYFYHGDLKQTLRNDTKQDHIRSRSKYLKEVIEFSLTSKKMYKGQKEHVYSNILLPPEQVGAISNILDRDYSEIRMIEHKFFNSRGTTIVFKEKNLNYSEAFAGSGEFSVAILVNKIFVAPNKSLIVLDEPEVSLHPGAQVRMLEFLLNRIKISKHQIIIGTHSPFILKNLPPEAIKTLFIDPESKKILATEKTSSNEAFFHLGATQNNKYKLFVEDRLAAELVKKALRTIGQARHERCDIIYPPGGASVLLCNYFTAYARTDSHDSLFVLDGDQQKAEDESLSGDLSIKTDGQLESLISSVLGGNVSLPIDSSRQDQQLREARIKVLSFAKSNLIYLPGNTPESFIWNNMTVDVQRYGNVFNSISCEKSKFEKLCKEELGRESYESVTSDEIFELQKRCLATLDSALFSELAEELKVFIDSQR